MKKSTVRFGSVNIGLFRKLCFGNNHLNAAQFEMDLNVAIEHRFSTLGYLNGDRDAFLPKLPSCDQ